MTNEKSALGIVAEVEKLKGEISGLLDMIKHYSRVDMEEQAARYKSNMMARDCTYYSESTRGLRCNPENPCTTHRAEVLTLLVQELRSTHRSCWQDAADDNRCDTCSRVDRLLLGAPVKAHPSTWT